jgi:DNA polymerase epsilon subunit 1
VKNIDVVDKEDLALVNHLSGKTGKFLRLSFKNVQDLSEVKYELLPVVEKNKLQRETQEAYEGWYNPSEMAENRK